MSPELERLVRVLPMPSAPHAAPDFDQAEATLQMVLPADYKELMEVYGGGFIDGYLRLLEPACSNRVYDLIKIAAEREDANEGLWEYGDRPPEMEIEGNRLVSWGATDNGEYLFWLVAPGDDPGSRPILINGVSDEDWERYDLTVTGFLAAVLSGEIRSELLWSNFPLPVHEFRTAHEMAH
ncbi:SMI1/KNR4 family protein [Streptomyces sp. NPDC055092]